MAKIHDRCNQINTRPTGFVIYSYNNRNSSLSVPDAPKVGRPPNLMKSGKSAVSGWAQKIYGDFPLILSLNPSLLLDAEVPPQQALIKSLNSFVSY